MSGVSGFVARIATPRTAYLLGKKHTHTFSPYDRLLAMSVSVDAIIASHKLHVVVLSLVAV